MTLFRGDPLSLTAEAFRTVQDAPSFVGYTGHTIAAIIAPGTSWANFLAMITASAWTDDISVGVVRDGSTWRVSSAGYYRLLVSLNTGGVDIYVGYRWQRDSVTLAQRSYYNSAGGGVTFASHPSAFEAILQLSAGDVLTLQSVRKVGASATWTPNNPLDGESMVTGNIHITRIGL